MKANYVMCCFFFSSRRRHTRWTGDWSSDVCSSDLAPRSWPPGPRAAGRLRGLRMRRETFAASPAWRRRRHSGAVGGQGLGSSFILRFIAAGRGMVPPSGSRHIEVSVVMGDQLLLSLIFRFGHLFPIAV